MQRWNRSYLCAESKNIAKIVVLDPGLEGLPWSGYIYPHWVGGGGACPFLFSMRSEPPIIYIQTNTCFHFRASNLHLLIPGPPPYHWTALPLSALITLSRHATRIETIEIDSLNQVEPHF